MQWIKQKPAIPEKEGWYRVMHPGDCETDGPHVYYDFPDYESWAYWQPADPEEFEDFDGGYKGSWQCQYNEEGDDIFAYYGPFEFPAYKDRDL